MPIIQPLQKNIYCWKNTESVDELISILNPNTNQLEKLAKFKSIERKKQFLTTRILLQKTIGDNKIEKGNNGKPYLQNATSEISLTHNKEYTLLITSPLSCGIDIQAPTETTVRVREKFINKNDFCSNSNDYFLLSQIWACKEAAFKKFGNHQIFLKENITVRNRSEGNIFDVLVHFEEQEYQVFLKLEKLENNYVLYTLN